MEKFKFIFQDASGKPSTRKIIAMFFIVLAIVEKAKLVFWSHWHFSVALKNHGVSDAVVITLVASLDAIAVLCLAVYGIKKNESTASDTPTDAPQTPAAPATPNARPPESAEG